MRIKNPTNDEVIERRLEFFKVFTNSGMNKKVSDSVFNAMAKAYDTAAEEYENCEEFLNEMLALYQQIIRTNIEIDEKAKKDNLFYLQKIGSKETEYPSILKLGLFDPTLFNMFENKNNYFQIMQYFQMNEMLQDKKIFSEFVQYSFNNREYYDYEEVFAAHLKRILSNIKNWEYQTLDLEKFYQEKTKENQKRIGEKYDGRIP